MGALDIGSGSLPIAILPSIGDVRLKLGPFAFPVDVQLHEFSLQVDDASVQGRDDVGMLRIRSAQGLGLNIVSPRILAQPFGCYETGPGTLRRCRRQRLGDVDLDLRKPVVAEPLRPMIAESLLPDRLRPQAESLACGGVGEPFTWHGWCALFDRTPTPPGKVPDPGRHGAMTAVSRYRRHG